MGKWIMMRQESFPALIKQPERQGFIKGSLHIAESWNGMVFNVFCNSNNPMVPWSSPVYSSWDTEGIFWRFDAHLKGIFHHQVWSDSFHPGSFFSSVWISYSHICRHGQNAADLAQVYTVLRRYHPNLQHGMVTLVVSTLQREQANLQAFLQKPFPKPGKTLSHSSTNLWQEFAAQLLHKEFQDRPTGKISSGFPKFVVAPGLLGGWEWANPLSLEMRWEKKGRGAHGQWAGSMQPPHQSSSLVFHFNWGCPISDGFPKNINLPS